MTIAKLIRELRKYKRLSNVYIQKQEFFGNVSHVFTVCRVRHPVTGRYCTLLTDGDDDMERPYRGISSCKNMTRVSDLISMLEKYDGNLEVMGKPKNGCKNFDNICGTELSSYGFFGKEIPCVLLVG